MIQWQTSKGVGRLSLDRPPLNVLDIPVSRRLESTMKRAVADPSVRVLVLSGMGKCFSAGVDIRDHTKARVKPMLKAFHGAVRALWNCPKPVVASLHGVCLGGGMELALCCDFVVARPGTRVGLPEITLGCFPPVAAALWPWTLGLQGGAEAILLGGVVPAKGLPWVSRESEAALLKRLLSQSGSALACAKRAMRAAVPFERALREAEKVYLTRLLRTRDMEEGVEAFLEKRPAGWFHA